MKRPLGNVRRGTFAAVLFASSAIAAPAVAQSVTGWTFAIRMDVDSGAGAPPVTMTLQQQRVPGKVRMVFSTPAFVGTQMEGMYSIMTDADSSLASVVPGLRMATVMNFGGMMANMEMPHAKAGAEQLTKDSLEDLGAADRIAGRPAHHYRETKTGTLEVTMGAQACTQHFDTAIDQWLSSDPELATVFAFDRSALADSPFEAFLPDLSSSSSKMPKGVPLRSVRKSTIGSPRGPKRTVTTSMEVVELRSGPIADSVFVVPKAYSTVDMRKMMIGMPPHVMDSAMVAEMTAQMKSMCDPEGPVRRRSYE